MKGPGPDSGFDAGPQEALTGFIPGATINLNHFPDADSMRAARESTNRKGRGRRVGRLLSLDALRGLAVVFMIGQHLVYWLGAELSTSLTLRAFGALGGLAAPLFVTLSGLGAALLGGRHENPDRLLLARGLMVMGFAYLLNFLTPHWFSMQSWYVLHLIGFGLLTAPLLRRAPNGFLFALVFIVIAATAGLQNYLDTPLRLSNARMAETDLPGGLLRLAAAESYFPILPWMALFIAGHLAGRWLACGRPEKMAGLGLGLAAGALLLSILYLAGFDFTRTALLVRVFKPIPYFYPALAPVTLFLMAAALVFIYIFVHVEDQWQIRAPDVLVALGRCSLSLLILHVAILREAAVRVHFWRSLSTPATVALTLAVIAGFTLMAVLWAKANFRYGAEWLLRRWG